MAFRSPSSLPKRWPTYDPSKTYQLPVRPSQGNVYYVRLNTPFGPAYKLGFTTLSSVEERLGFQGKGDELLIDEVLYFEHWDNAYDMETELHALLIGKQAFQGHHARLEDMPLAGNGQSEVYLEDVLGMDWQYTPEQSTLALQNIRTYGFKQEGVSEEEIVAKFEAEREKIAEHQELLKTYAWVGRAHDALLKFLSMLFGDVKRSEVARGRSAARTAELIARLKEKPAAVVFTDEDRRISEIKRNARAIRAKALAQAKAEAASGSTTQPL